MPFLRNEFLKIFENFRGPFYDYVIFKDENTLRSTLELKTKARDLNLTLVTFWIFLAGKCPLEQGCKSSGPAELKSRIVTDFKTDFKTIWPRNGHADSLGVNDQLCEKGSKNS